jgi:two-component system, OmpR family, response regulator
MFVHRIHELAKPNRDDTPAESSNARRILVVDPDPEIRHMVISRFEDHGVPATWVSAPEDLRRVLKLANPQLVILDDSFGQKNSLEILKKIRSESDVPVIMTASNPGNETDRVVALEFGADDFVTKPYSVRELLARVRAVLRRGQIGRPARSRGPERGGYQFNGWRLERRSRRLFDPAGEPVSLTKGQYALLLAFLEAPQRPLTREELLNATRVHEDVFDRSIDVQVLRLRRKLEVDLGAPRIIKTERGAGYVFDMPVERF